MMRLKRLFSVLFVLFLFLSSALSALAQEESKVPVDFASLRHDDTDDALGSIPGTKQFGPFEQTVTQYDFEKALEWLAPLAKG